MDNPDNPPDRPGSRLLSFDGSETGRTEISQLVLLKQLMERIEDREDLDETPPPWKYFDLIGGTGVGGIFAIFFAAWRLTVDEAIIAYYKLYENVFTSEAWSNQDAEESKTILEKTVCDIADELDKNADQMLGATKVSATNQKAFTCTVNPENLTHSRLLCTYRPRANRSPKCTVTQAITASIADQAHLNPVVLGMPPEKFISAHQRVPNPTFQLLSEVEAVCGPDQPVACVVSLGAGQRRPIASAMGKESDYATLIKLVSDTDQSDQELERRCGAVKDFFFRLNVIHGLEESPTSSDALSAIATHSNQYLKLMDIGKKLARLVKVVCERPQAVTAGQLNAILGPDAQDRTLEVVKEVNTGVKQIHAIEQDERLHRLMTWLSPDLSFNSTMRECRKIREEGTGIWLVESDKFHKWVAGDARILTLQGIPGGGKTILASIVYDHLTGVVSAETHLVLGAFITYGTTRSIEDVLACLLSQLVHDGKGQLALRLDSLYKNCSYGQPSREELVDLLQSRLSEASSVMIVLDAPDEFPLDNRQELINTILHISSSISLFVTTRPLPEMHLPEVIQMFSNMDVSNRADLKHYVEKRMQYDRRLAKVLFERTDLSDKVLEFVLGRSNGMFLLTRYHMDELATYRTSVALENALPNLPTTASEKYANALDRMKQQPGRDGLYAVHVLMWMSLALTKHRPLTIGQLILAVMSSTDELANSENRLVTLTELDIVEVCSGLVLVKGDKAMFVHQTAREYFREHFGCESPSPHLCDSQHIIALGCLRYILHSRSQNLISKWLELNSTGKWDASDDSERFFKYCAVYWGDHAGHSSANAIDEMALKLFSTEPLWALCKCILVHDLRWRLRPADSDIDCLTALHFSSFFGLTSMSSKLLLSTNINSRDAFGRSPLFYASTMGHYSVVELLLRHVNVEADFLDSLGRTPLSYSSEAGHKLIVSILLGRSDVAADTRDTHGRSPLWYAAKAGHKDIVELLLGRTDVDPDSRDKKQMSPLLRAVVKGCPDIVKILLSHPGVDANQTGNFGRSCLHFAAERGHEEVFKLILARKDVMADLQDDAGETPLFHAVENGHRDIVELLLNRSDVNADSRSYIGVNPLALTTRRDIIQLLLSKSNVNPYAKDIYGNSALTTAGFRGDEDIIMLFLESRPAGSRIYDVLSSAVADGHPILVKHLLRMTDVDLGHIYDKGRTLISYARWADTLQLLLGRDDVDPNSRDDSGNSPLCYAAEQGWEIDAIKLLLNWDTVYPDSKDNSGQTPLCHAARKGNLVAIQLFLTRDDVDPDSKDNSGQTPLCHAAREGNPDAVKLFLTRNDVDVNSKDCDGCSVLYHAATGLKRDYIFDILVESFRGTVELLLGCEKLELDEKALVQLAKFYTELWRWERESETTRTSSAL